jgi:hypothetical protein
MSKKIPIQIHMLYTTHEFLYDRIIINWSETLTYWPEDYENTFQEENLWANEYEWYEEIQAQEDQELAALTSKNGLTREFIQLEWLDRLEKLLMFLEKAKPDLFIEWVSLNLSIYLEIIDTTIIFEKILIWGWSTIMTRFKNSIKVTRFFLIWKNLIQKRNIIELEVSAKVNITELVIKNIDIENLKIKGYTKLLKIWWSKIGLLLWRPNRMIYEIKKDKSILVIATSEVWKVKLGTYEDTFWLFSSIRFIQSIITDYIQISGMKILHKKDDLWGLKFENTTFHPWANLSIQNSEIDYLNLNKTFLGKLDVRNTTMVSVYLSESNIYNSYFSWISWDWLYSLIQRNNKPTNSEIKEYYRHFKHSHDEIWNKSEANKFYQKEMEYYRKSLWDEKPRKWQKIIISYLNDLISDYGLNWWRAFKFYFFFCLFIYVTHEFIRIHNSNIPSFLSWVYGFWEANWQNLWHLNWNNSEFNKFGWYLNPVPELKWEKTIFWLLFSTLKILIVYQIVVGIRRISQR